MNGIPRLTYQQYRAVRRLVHDCCNYDGGNCLALDDGWEPCVCVQSITYSLVCKWFRAAVLPTDKGPLTVGETRRDGSIRDRWARGWVSQ